MASFRICPSTRRAIPRVNSCGDTTGEVSRRLHLSSGRKSGPETIRGITKGRISEKHLDSHCDSNLFPVWMSSSPYRSKTPPLIESGFEQSLGFKSNVNALGRTSSKQFSNFCSASPGVAFFVVCMTRRFFRFSLPFFGLTLQFPPGCRQV